MLSLIRELRRGVWSCGSSLVTYRQCHPIPCMNDLRHTNRIFPTPRIVSVRHSHVENAETQAPLPPLEIVLMPKSSSSVCAVILLVWVPALTHRSVRFWLLSIFSLRALRLRWWYLYRLLCVFVWLAFGLRCLYCFAVVLVLGYAWLGLCGKLGCIICRWFGSRAMFV